MSDVKAKKREALRLEREKNDLLAILDMENGRRFLWRMLTYCGVYRDIEGTGTDVYGQIGRRRVGLYLMGIVSDADEEKVFTMMREAKLRQQEEDYQLDIETKVEEMKGKHESQPTIFIEDLI